MEKASCWKARQKANRRRRRKRSIAGNSLGPPGTGCNVGSGPGSSVSNGFGFACMSKRKRAQRMITGSPRTRPFARLARDPSLRSGCQASSGANWSAPDVYRSFVLTPPPVPRFRPRGASSRERARLLRRPPRLPPVPWLRPLPSPARGAHCGSTPCRFRQG